jgi:hypothetical protein
MWTGAEWFPHDVAAATTWVGVVQGGDRAGGHSGDRGGRALDGAMGGGPVGECGRDSETLEGEAGGASVRPVGR